MDKNSDGFSTGEPLRNLPRLTSRMRMTNYTKVKSPLSLYDINLSANDGIIVGHLAELFG